MLSRLRFAHRSSSRRRRAFTLLEVLIATAITLLMMLSLVQVFKIIGDSMKQGRAALQMNNTLRAVTFRLRNDLSNLTVRVDPPADQGAGGGYLEYFDGSMTDYSPGLYGSASLNRYGDLDDILMFTARAGDSWFTGQAPGSVVGGSGTVTLTSQLAEIVVFARPVATGVALFDDSNSDGFPDAFQLHYRVLLIRPDLNNAAGILPGLTINRAADSPTEMASFFQTYDISMHRVYDGSKSTDDGAAANSLEDLANPANRFAHFQYPVPGTNGSCTMPMLVLQSIPRANFAPTASLPYSDQNPASLPPALTHAGGNFLDPSFVLSGARTGEDILATNVLAFDVKGYDSGAPIIGLPGPTNTGAFTGADGSDDVVLTPNDPGFAVGHVSAAAATPIGFGAYVDLGWGRKALTSLAAHRDGSGTQYDFTDIYPRTSLGTRFSSELSGIEGALGNVATPAITSTALNKSGKRLQSSTYEVYQPTFDTWTTAFESNGTLQTQLGAATGTVDVNAYARLKDSSAGTDSSTTPIDAGTDGIDNNGTGGVDEAAERETSPPFPVKLRGIKISVRIEDIATRQVKQMSVANEFVTQ